MRLRVGAGTDIGRVRALNEDVYVLRPAEGWFVVCADMGTTVVSAWVEQSVASVAHVGDSRAYLWHDHDLELLTSDHSLVEAQVAAGVLDREHSLQSERQNILLRVLGGEPDVDVDLN